MIYIVYSEEQNCYDAIETKIILVTLDNMKAIETAKTLIKESNKNTNILLDIWNNDDILKQYFHYEINKL